MTIQPRFQSRALAAFAFDPAASRAPVTLPAPPEGLGLDGYREELRSVAGRRQRVLVPKGRGARALVRDAVLESDPEASAPGDPQLRRAKVWRVETNPALRLLPVDLRLAAMDYAALVEGLENARGQDFLSPPGGSARTPDGPSLGRLAMAETLRRCDDALAGRSVVLAMRDPVVRHLPAVYGITLRDALRAVAVEGLDRRAILRRIGVHADIQRLAHAEGRLSQGISEAATRVGVVLGVLPRHALDGLGADTEPRARRKG